MGSSVIRAVFKRDLRSWFGNPAGYVFITLFVFLAALAMIGDNDFFRRNLANLDTLNNWYRLLLLLFVPAVTMGMWTSERAHGTHELLFTLPAKESHILIGKYLAAAGIFTVSLAFTLVLPLGLTFLGSPDWGLLFSNYLGFWLFGLMLLSVAMIGSQLTENLTVSFILGVMLCAAVAYTESVLSFLPGYDRIGTVYGPTALFQEMGRGIVSTGSLLMFLGLTLAFLYLNLVLLSRRTWNDPKGQTLHRGLRFGSILAMVLGMVVVGMNALPRIDTTSEGIHSLSEDTERLISELDPNKPVYIQAFVSQEMPQGYVSTKRNLLNLLSRYDSLGGDAVQVRVIDTEPFTNEATEAEQNYGIRARQVADEEGSQFSLTEIFLGIVVQCGPEEVPIPFVERKLPIEYELTRSIRVAANADRRKVGVLKTDVDIFGGFDFQTMQQTPPWEMVNELRLQYEVEAVDAEADYPEDLDVLLVPMGSSLTQPQMDRLAAHIGGGGPTLWLDDPFPIDGAAAGKSPTDPRGGQQNPFQQQQTQPEPKGDVLRMLREFGIEWPYGQIAGDGFRPHPEFEPQVTPEMVFVTPNSGARMAFNPDSPITSGLQELVTLFGGHVREVSGSGMTFTPLMTTGRNGLVINKEQAFQRSMFGGVGINPNRVHRPAPDLVLGAHVRGTPNGGSDEVQLIFIPDLDMMSSQFFALRRQGVGNTDIQFDNVAFLLNCVDVLAGDESFIALRKRRPRLRTLTTLEAQQEEFNTAWRSAREKAEAEANEDLAAAQARLDNAVDAVRSNPDLDENSKQVQIQTIQSIERRKFELAKTRIERQKESAVKAAETTRRGEIASIQGWYQTITLAWTPLPALIIAFQIYRRKRRREQGVVPDSRRVGSTEGGAS